MEGKVLQSRVVHEKDISVEQLKKITAGLAGDYLQKPPAYSAKKISGKPAYYYARMEKGEGNEKLQDLKPSVVKIHSIKILSIEIPDVKIKIRCSSGTYIRSVVHDIGERMGCGATLTGLVRDAIGEFKLKDCLTLDEITGIASDGETVKYRQGIIPLEKINLQHENSKLK